MSFCHRGPSYLTSTVTSSLRRFERQMTLFWLYVCSFGCMCNYFSCSKNKIHWLLTAFENGVIRSLKTLAMHFSVVVDGITNTSSIMLYAQLTDQTLLKTLLSQEIVRAVSIAPWVNRIFLIQKANSSLCRWWR